MHSWAKLKYKYRCILELWAYNQILWLLILLTCFTETKLCLYSLQTNTITWILSWRTLKWMKNCVYFRNIKFGQLYIKIGCVSFQDSCCHPEQPYGPVNSISHFILCSSSYKFLHNWYFVSHVENQMEFIV